MNTTQSSALDTLKSLDTLPFTFISGSVSPRVEVVSSEPTSDFKVARNLRLKTDFEPGMRITPRQYQKVRLKPEAKRGRRLCTSKQCGNPPPNLITLVRAAITSSFPSLTLPYPCLLHLYHQKCMRIWMDHHKIIPRT